MRNALLAFVAAFVLVAPVVATAQTQSVTLGLDTITQPDGGILRRVAVDPLGRFITTSGPIACSSASVNANTSVGVASTNVPATPLAGRTYQLTCNSPQNAGTPLVKCRADNTAPVMALGNAGEVLEVGDCVTYTLPADAGNVKCISDTAATNVTTYECK